MRRHFGELVFQQSLSMLASRVASCVFSRLLFPTNIDLCPASPTTGDKEKASLQKLPGKLLPQRTNSSKKTANKSYQVEMHIRWKKGFKRKTKPCGRESQHLLTIKAHLQMVHSFPFATFLALYFPDFPVQANNEANPSVQEISTDLSSSSSTHGCMQARHKKAHFCGILSSLRPWCNEPQFDSFCHYNTLLTGMNWLTLAMSFNASCSHVRGFHRISSTWPCLVHRSKRL